MSDSNRTSILGIGASLAISVLVALAGSDGSSTVGGLAVFALCGLVSFAVNWLVYVPSARAKTEHYYDLTGSITYVIVTITALVLSDEIDTRAVIVSVLVLVWAARLGSFLFRRVKRDGRDGRFDRIKVDPLRFLMTWTMQGLWVYLTLACTLAIITGADRRPIDAFVVVGVVVWTTGFVIEVIADRQKSEFRRDTVNDGRFIHSGLWAWSRHPNYFGEITLWVGIAIIALPVLSGWRWATLISPVFVFLLLTRVSGVPMLERRGKKRWGDDESYLAYVESTPVLIPRPPRTR